MGLTVSALASAAAVTVAEGQAVTHSAIEFEPGTAALPGIALAGLGTVKVRVTVTVLLVTRAV